MPIAFPVGLDNFTNPTPADNLNTPAVLHSDQHSNLNDAVEALEVKVGVNGSLVTGTFDFRVNYLESNQHSPVTLGTANGLLLVGQQLSVGLSSTNTTGTLSSADWNTFNNKVPSIRMISGAFPIFGGGDLSVDRTLSMPQAGTGTSGYLSSVDFNTFNSKQGALSFPLSPSFGGSGINNSGTFTYQSNTTITGGGTIALGGFTLTVPATGTAALLATANIFTADQTIKVPAANPTSTTLTLHAPFSGADARDKLLLISSNSGSGSGTVKFIGQGVQAELILQVTDNSSTSTYKFNIGYVNWSTNDIRSYPSSGSLVTHTLGLNATASRFTRGYDTSGSELAYFDWNTATKLQFRIGGTSRAHQLLSGLWSIFPEDAVTNAVTNVLTLQHDSSGTPAAGFGVGLPFYAETATAGTAQPQGLISTSWIDPTNAIRKAKMSLSAYDTVARLGIEIEASGSAAMLGFFGAATVVQQANTTDLGVVLSNLGLRASGTAYPITTSGAVTLGSLTAGRVTFAGTGGLLSDDADMTFATDTLTVTKIIGSTSIKVGTAAGYISSDGSTGATGTFTTADLKTVTVKDGIVVSIV